MEYPVFESRGCGFCRVESRVPGLGGIWTRDQRTNYCEFLKERDRFFYKLCNGIKLRLERENQVLFVDAY